MKRVKYPFIVRYSEPLGVVKYACEDADEEGFMRVSDQLRATVYTDTRQFVNCYGMTPTEVFKLYAADDASMVWQYVGE